VAGYPGAFSQRKGENGGEGGDGPVKMLGRLLASFSTSVYFKLATQDLLAGAQLHSDAFLVDAAGTENPSENGEKCAILKAGATGCCLTQQSNGLLHALSAVFSDDIYLGIIFLVGLNKYILWE
jgi:hypothetical protein